QYRRNRVQKKENKDRCLPYFNCFGAMPGELIIASERYEYTKSNKTNATGPVKIFTLNAHFKGLGRMKSILPSLP
ncbi:MAG TPA: hypothetical protein VEV15_04380, partial [Flavisolibacter sp.]|nr:hypothetical protein [Flavisolibacter sp.]